MPLEANKQLIRRMFAEDLNTKNREAGQLFFTADFIDHTNPPELQHGIDGHNRLVALLHAAFPDIHYTIDDIFAEADRVCVRVTLHGTHEGDFFGIPPTGKHVMVGGTHILRIRDGKIAEHWGNNDDLSMMHQLGAMRDTVEPELR
ncbi:MAG: ester cyclase [Anaerolineaceae bacterium]|nr:ester cyclase [Anaerolineaceae bacterium]